MKSFTLAVLIAGFLVVLGEKVRYDNYRVYSIQVENGKQLKVLNDLEKLRDEVSFMEPPHAVQQTAKIVVSPHKLAYITDLFEAYEMKNELRTENLQK